MTRKNSPSKKTTVVSLRRSQRLLVKSGASRLLSNKKARTKQDTSRKELAQELKEMQEKFELATQEIAKLKQEKSQLIAQSNGKSYLISRLAEQNTILKRIETRDQQKIQDLEDTVKFMEKTHEFYKRHIAFMNARFARWDAHVARVVADL
uniref:Uncharacterized protein n=1 Tax=Entomoneis paludosa TaxID=265537 RepID=A0A7S2YEL8_9STRA|mmetsp:Transcript_29245/g.61202  ORF Transcript_29245/g.61202 Transcript_29245/m.61202 type:complete len:151 (+) Transcript_29245:408-860(+)